MKTLKLLCLLIFLLIPTPLSARDNVNYWYIKDFQQEIIVNQDASLLITEKITADCGNASNKHGIYRTLSTRYQKTAEESVLTPIYLKSITDFNNQPLKYEEIKDQKNYTITWKIGDPQKTVQGENFYQIKYLVKNTIRFDSSAFDEFYWNLNGNFWDIETDLFKSWIIFPQSITQSNAKVDYYTSRIGSKDRSLASFLWSVKNVLEFKATQTLKVGEGITVSVTFPKNIITPYQLTDEDQKYYQGAFSMKKAQDNFGSPFWFLMPLIVLIVSFILWFKHGRDPRVSKTITPEFEIPEKLQPMEMGMIISDGGLRSKFISAAIINLAVKGKIKIEQIKNRKFLIGKEDYQLTIIDKDQSDLTDSEKLLIEKLFAGASEVKVSSLRNKFYQDIPEIQKLINNNLKEKNWLNPKSRKFFKIYFILAFVLIFFLTGIIRTIYLFFNSLIAGIILFIFALLMRQRPKEGAKLLRRIKGFKLYIDTAEKYRQRFNEKENIFEKFLPYAMIFGITKIWIEKMKIIYGKDYFATYHPVWFTGAAITTFNVGNFNTMINSFSANMSSTISSSPSSSGSGGGGFSGGGGGGGGGGGW